MVVDIVSVDCLIKEASCLCLIEADLLRLGLHRLPRLPFTDELLLFAVSGVDVDKMTGEQNTASLTRGLGGRLRLNRVRPLSRGTGGNATNCCESLYPGRVSTGVHDTNWHTV